MYFYNHTSKVTQRHKQQFDGNHCYIPVVGCPSRSLSDLAFTMAAADTRDAMEFSVGLRSDGEPKKRFQEI